MSFNSWALAIARNHIHKRYRSDQRDKHLFKSDALEALAGAYERLSDSSEDMRAALDQCVDLLPERSRRIVELRYQQDKRVDSIAAMLGSSANAVSGVLFRVRQSLKKCIEKRMADGGKR